MPEPHRIRVMQDIGGWYRFCLGESIKVYMDTEQLGVLLYTMEPLTDRQSNIMVAFSRGGELVQSEFDAGFKTWDIPGIERITFGEERYTQLRNEVREQLDRLTRPSPLKVLQHQMAVAATMLMLCTTIFVIAQPIPACQPSAISPTVATQVAVEAKRFAKHHPADVARIIATTQARKVMFQKYATKIGVKPSLLAGVMAQECRGNDTGSLRGRYFGPMQVNRSYIRTRKLPMRTVADGYRAGADYLQRECLAQFGGDQLLALAAFNGGYPSIKRAVRWGSLPSRGGTRRSLTAVRQLALHRPKQYRYAIGVLAKAKIIDEHNVFQAGE